MKREEILGKVQTIVSSKLGISEDEVVESSSFANDLGADSLDIIEIICEVEKEFSFEIADSDSENMETVEQLVTIISNNIPQE